MLAIAFDAWLDQHLDSSLAELSRLVAQPSVGAQNWGIPECAALVADMLGVPAGELAGELQIGADPTALGGRDAH